MNGRLVRKTLGFSKQLTMLEAACIWEDVVYNFNHGQIPLEVAAGNRVLRPFITAHIWFPIGTNT